MSVESGFGFISGWLLKLVLFPTFHTLMETEAKRRDKGGKVGMLCRTDVACDWEGGGRDMGGGRGK